MNSEYFLSTTTTSVAIWLSRRLPFEPTGFLSEARAELRSSLQKLQSQGSAILDAAFYSRMDAFFDVENVLIYNVGAAAFKSVANAGLRFRRVRNSPPPCPNGLPYSYYHEYRLAPAPPRPDGALSAAFTFTLDSLSSTTKPHEIWWAATQPIASGGTAPIRGAYSLYLELGTSKPLVNVAVIIKPLIDGVVSAMHFDSGPEFEAVRRLCGHCRREESEIRMKLQTPLNPILGARTLLKAYRDGIKWDPADDLCEDCAVVVKPAKSLNCTLWISPTTHANEI